ncbi:dockerin type I domain-containing protein [Geosporobacter ferrireducens]|uniref:dockerin type I domain-containing protein n=1 Tax=Geosporobacter ferrireducens TaxID=1424294 RepID=UPI00139C35D2|nr:dockerin type I domain-containing protein [Geosporobacter ferrireducens]MTI57481.1 hypothetical protein [Geosporobacter ferrireducens]
MRKKVISLYLVLIVFTVFVHPVQAQTIPSFTLEMEKETVYIDTNLLINVGVSDYVYGAVYSTSAIDFSVLFDPSILEYTGFTTLENFHATVRESVYSEVYNSQRIIISMVGQENAVNADTELITLNFRPKKIADTELIIYRSVAGTSAGTVFYPKNTSTVVRICHPYDVNQDGAVNIADLASVSYHVGKSAGGYPNYDVNRDGVIDSTDVDLITEYLLNS